MEPPRSHGNRLARHGPHVHLQSLLRRHGQPVQHAPAHGGAHCPPGAIGTPGMTPVERIALFPIEQYWWFYLAFTGAVLLLLVVDLGLFHRKAHTVSFSEAGTWVFVWVALALLFCYGLYSYSLMAFAHDPRLMAIAGFDPGEAAS